MYIYVWLQGNIMMLPSGTIKWLVGVNASAKQASLEYNALMHTDHIQPSSFALHAVCGYCTHEYCPAWGPVYLVITMTCETPV